VSGDPGTCRACGAAILWVVHQRTGRPAPLELDPEGGWEIEGEAYRLASPDTPRGRWYTNHFGTCPEASRFRRRRE
jgi:hypothetical protein